MKKLIALLLLLPVLAHADDDDTEMINLMADCSGTWEFFAMADDATGDTASAKQMRERRNGAVIAAQYLLALEYKKRTGKEKMLKEFGNYVTARSEPMKTALMAYFEREDFDLIEVEFKKCDAALVVQDKLIQDVRESNILTECSGASFLKYFYLEPNEKMSPNTGAVVDFSKCFSLRNKYLDDLAKKKKIQLEEDMAQAMALKLGAYFYRQKAVAER